MKNNLLSFILIMFGWFNATVVVNASEPEELVPFSEEEVQTPATTLEKDVSETAQPEALEPFSTREVEFSQETDEGPFTVEETETSSTAIEEEETSSATSEDDDGTFTTSSIEGVLGILEGGNVNVFFGYSAWLNQWQLSIPLYENEGKRHRMAVTSESELVSMLSLKLQAKKFSLSGSFIPERTYQFPEIDMIYLPSVSRDLFSNICEPGNCDDTIMNTIVDTARIQTTAERREWSITANYEVLRNEGGGSLSIGGGIKRVNFDHKYHLMGADGKGGFFDDPVTSEDLNENIRKQSPLGKTVRMSGLSLNVSGNVPLLYDSYGLLGLYGSFAYGAFKMKYESSTLQDNNNYTPYYLAEVGLSYTLPLKEKTKFLYSATATAGYRTQSFYQESSSDDALDTTEGFTLGVIVAF